MRERLLRRRALDAHHCDRLAERGDEAVHVAGRDVAHVGEAERAVLLPGLLSARKDGLEPCTRFRERDDSRPTSYNLRRRRRGCAAK